MIDEGSFDFVFDVILIVFVHYVRRCTFDFFFFLSKDTPISVLAFVLLLKDMT